MMCLFEESRFFVRRANVAEIRKYKMCLDKVLISVMSPSLTHLCFCLHLGFYPAVQTQTDGHGHAGHTLPSSLTVLVKDVDPVRFKGQSGLDLHHSPRPGQVSVIHEKIK